MTTTNQVGREATLELAKQTYKRAKIPSSKLTIAQYEQAKFYVGVKEVFYDVYTDEVWIDYDPSLFDFGAIAREVTEVSP